MDEVRQMFLEQIKEANDIKKIDRKDYEQLAEEIRQFLIEKISVTGGHLGSNLGAVELTMALHLALDLPEDKIIWDVGHQIYTHKLLTGRYDEFKTLRQKDGISGFSRPNESEHDIVFSGHSSVSISTAMGIAAANKVNGKKDAAIAVLGDGALTGGLVYEALNNTRALKDTKLIIILNDNGMSISKNVGNLAKRLAVMRSTKEYFQIKSLAEKIISKIPFIGAKLADKILKAKTADTDIFKPELDAIARNVVGISKFKHLTLFHTDDGKKSPPFKMGNTIMPYLHNILGDKTITHGKDYDVKDIDVKSADGDNSYILFGNDSNGERVFKYQKTKRFIEELVKEALLDLQTIPTGSIHFVPVSLSQYLTLMGDNKPNVFS